MVVIVGGGAVAQHSLIIILIKISCTFCPWIVEVVDGAWLIF